MTEALIGFIAIFGLALLRMPLAFSMGLVGVVGVWRTFYPVQAAPEDEVHP